MKVTLAKGGTDEREVNINKIQIPDLWHIAMYLRKTKQVGASNLVLETWHLAHDLRRHIAESE